MNYTHKNNIGSNFGQWIYKMKKNKQSNKSPSKIAPRIDQKLQTKDGELLMCAFFIMYKINLIWINKIILVSLT